MRGARVRCTPNTPAQTCHPFTQSSLHEGVLELRYRVRDLRPHELLRGHHAVGEHLPELRPAEGELVLLPVGARLLARYPRAALAVVELLEEHRRHPEVGE